MRALKVIEALLEERIGLSVDAVGSEVIARAVRSRMGARGISDISAYHLSLLESSQEMEALIESVVIPETWFFRNKQSFHYLDVYIRSEWLPSQREKTLRVLSIPCSTGEEPYSIAITLLDAGMPEHCMKIDAVDVSKKALDKARRGEYGPESFRDKHNLGYRERYFQQLEQQFQIHETLKKRVRFFQGNLLDEDVLSSESPYHVVFCRNLLIYLGEAAKHQAVHILERFLAHNGILFVGHAERPAFHGVNVSWIRQSGVFACRKAPIVEKPVQRPPQQREPKKAGEKITNVSSPPSISREKVPEKKPTALPQEADSELPRPRFERRKQRREAAPKRAEHRSPFHFLGRRKLPMEPMKSLDAARQKADQGALDEALEICNHVLNQRAADVQAHFLKGLIYQALGDDEQAEQWLHKTVYLDPNHAEALHYLAFLAEYHGDQKRADVLRQRMKRIQSKLSMEEP